MHKKFKQKLHLEEVLQIAFFITNNTIFQHEENLIHFVYEYVNFSIFSVFRSNY